MDSCWQQLLGAKVAYTPPSWLSSISTTSATSSPATEGLIPAIPQHLIPADRLVLGRFPTPMQRFNIPGISELGIDCYIKRDDLSSFDLSGNKVRKLEFLLADAMKTDETGAAVYDSVITIGGIQSNHARATAVASRQIGLDPYLILRTPLEPATTTAAAATTGEVTAGKVDGTVSVPEVGLTGNLLFNRMVGADIRLVSPATYAVIGSDRLCQQLAEELSQPQSQQQQPQSEQQQQQQQPQSEQQQQQQSHQEQQQQSGRRPYVIPVGGSNALGVFGYVECMKEIIQQQQQLAGGSFDHIVFACGSGGTAAGLSIAARLSGLSISAATTNDATITSTSTDAAATTSTTIASAAIDAAATTAENYQTKQTATQLHAIGVCDSPDYFYNHIEEMAAALQLNTTAAATALGPVREWLNIYSGVGIGYAKSTSEELEYLAQIGKSSGIILDPVYSGKALYHFASVVVPSMPEVFQRGHKLLFIHTGGTVGLYDKEAQLLPLLGSDRISRMKVRPPSPKSDVLASKLL